MSYKTGTRSTGLIKSFKDLQKVVEYLKPMHVKRIVVEGIEIEFDTAAALLMSPSDRPRTIDDQEERVTKAKRSLQDILEDAQADELWSSAP